MNELPRMYGSPARLVEKIELPHFLDLAYERHHGEVWLFNNDLEMIRDPVCFRDLYLARIAGSLMDQVDAVRILVRKCREEWVFGPNYDMAVYGALEQLAGMAGGVQRLSTFYFGRMSEIHLPRELEKLTEAGDTWIFYTHRGEMSDNPGLVMVRHTQFPFESKKGNVAVVWQLRDQELLQEQLKASFATCFQRNKSFRWLRVNPKAPQFSYTLVEGESAETLRRRKRHAGQAKHFYALDMGDSVHAAVFTALDTEMAAVQGVFGEGIPTPAKLDSNRYVVLNDGPRKKLVLISQIADMGGIPAATCAWDVITRWNPKYVILVGVAGGDPNEKAICLGDLAISNLVVAYEGAKVTDLGRHSRQRTYGAGQNLLRAAAQARQSWCPELKNPRPDGTYRAPTVHSPFAFASGCELVASEKEFESLRAIHDEIHATEMEGEGIAYACTKHPRHPEFIIIKGIMDKSDQATRGMPNKDKWKLYAGEAAASFAKEVVFHLAGWGP